MGRLSSFLRLIDAINDVAGRLFSFLLIPLMVITAIEVICRYVFNRPTIWAWDTNIQLFGALILIGGGYALLHNTHVSVDLLVSRLTLRVKAFLNLFTSALFFFAYGILLWQTSLVAWQSVKMKELYTSVWSPPIYFLKALIPIAVFLFLLQGVARFIRDILTLLHHQGGEA